MIALPAKRFAWLGFFVLLFMMGGATLAYAESVEIIDLSPAGGISPGQQVSFGVYVSGFTSPTYAVSDPFGGTSGAIDSVGYFTWTPVVTDAGFHTITVTVSDNYSHQATAAVTIQVVNNGTVLVQGFSPGPLVGVNKAVTFTAAAPGFINPTFSVSDAYVGTTVTNADMNLTSGSFSWTPASNQQGPHVLTVSAIDLFGHSGTAVQTFTVGGLSFYITPAKPASPVPVGTAVTFNAVAGSPGTISYMVNDIFTGTTTISSSNLSAYGAFSWMPALSDIGLHGVVVTASDSLGNAASTTALIKVIASPMVQTSQTPASTTSLPATTGSVNQPSGSAKGDGYVFKIFLTVGSNGTAVSELQKRLAVAGLYSGPVTGYYGVLTTAAVKKFQTAHNLEPVGYVGPGTRAALNSI